MAEKIPELGGQYWLTMPMQRSGDIWVMQDRLVKSGAAIRVDGVFGAATREALIAFQHRSGLKADGILGPLTWRALHGAAGPGDFENAADNFLNVHRLGANHRRYPASIAWRIGRDGLVVEDMPPAFTAGEKEMAAGVYNNLGDRIRSESVRYKVPVELVVATICTESGGRPRVRRLEPGCDRADPERTPHRVSVGLMQTLLSTAREALGDKDLRLADLENPQKSIAAGMAYMWRQARQTRFDPPLVAAAYNAGSLRHTTRNRWKLVSTGNHVDRFVNFFNACWAEGLERPLPEPAVIFSGFFRAH